MWLTGGIEWGMSSTSSPAVASGSVAVASVPVAHGVVAGLIAVAVSDPVWRAAVGAVWHWPRQVYLQMRGTIRLTTKKNFERENFVGFEPKLCKITAIIPRHHYTQCEHP